MNALVHFLKNKKGNFSIMYVTIILIVVLAVTAFIDILKQSWTIQEVQSIMDVAGVSALRTGVDETKLRLEIFSVNTQLVENSYTRMVSKQLDNAGSISDYRFIRTKVRKIEPEKWGLGETNKARPQAMIDSTMVIIVESSPTFDMVPGAAKVFYDSKDDTSFAVTYNGKTEDGKIELIIRSVSRIVYR